MTGCVRDYQEKDWEHSAVSACATIKAALLSGKYDVVRHYFEENSDRNNFHAPSVTSLSIYFQSPLAKTLTVGGVRIFEHESEKFIEVRLEGLETYHFELIFKACQSECRKDLVLISAGN